MPYARFIEGGTKAHPITAGHGGKTRLRRRGSHRVRTESGPPRHPGPTGSSPPESRKQGPSSPASSAADRRLSMTGSPGASRHTYPFSSALLSHRTNRYAPKRPNGIESQVCQSGGPYRGFVCGLSGGPHQNEPGYEDGSDPDRDPHSSSLCPNPRRFHRPEAAVIPLTTTNPLEMPYQGAVEVDSCHIQNNQTPTTPATKRVKPARVRSFISGPNSRHRAATQRLIPSEASLAWRGGTVTGAGASMRPNRAFICSSSGTDTPNRSSNQSANQRRWHSSPAATLSKQSNTIRCPA